MPAYSELTRRLGFKYNGMILHELYFGNLTSQGSTVPKSRSPLEKAITESFGSFNIWKTDFSSIGKMCGVGWAICYQNPHNGRLSNHWVSLHEFGNVAGFRPLLVMDVWEHAYLLDFQPSERGNISKAFFRMSIGMSWLNVNRNLIKGTFGNGTCATLPRKRPCAIR
jgi:superoxide dismutase, Fe-Mn family